MLQTIIASIHMHSLRHLICSKIRPPRQLGNFLSPNAASSGSS
ncbi:hypothetical protein Hsero_1582 [Herbaspirillum seropedicae SmR1]|uniref:Uncharacterized protein n=1 Tax=Herbaspirillum seropedicae (strain SmR1) TaxID=757424 RepID=D8IQ49_HERSS|nr:hypothetical protein Hsero_1582 [Herbaspirillum seropedicae SmR1]